MSRNSKPNVLILMTDQQQQETIRKGSNCKMPNVERLKKTGTTFTEARTVNAICSPARAGLITGRLPHNHGMVDNSHCVEPFRADFKHDQNTISRQLKSHGYKLGYFGKWHVERSDDPGNFGFDHYTTEHHGKTFKRTIENPRIVKHKGYNDRTLYGVHSESVEETEEFYFYSEGMDFIKSVKDTGTEPWCTFISTNAPHDPYIAPKEMYDLYKPEDFNLPDNFDDPMKDKPVIYQRLKEVWKDLDYKDYQEIMACYYANCSLVDTQVGRILDYLEESGQRDNTIILFLSDHGELLGSHGLLCKGIPAFDETYRIPMIYSWPGQIPESEERKSYVSIIDVAPTILALTNCQAMEKIDGKSVKDILTTGKEDDRSVYAEFFGQRLSYSQRLVWKGQYKYVFNGFDYDELYDLKNDPGEMTNLTNDTAYNDVKESLVREMWLKARESDDKSLLEAEYFMFRFVPVGPEVKKVASIYNRGA